MAFTNYCEICQKETDMQEGKTTIDEENNIWIELECPECNTKIQKNIGTKEWYGRYKRGDYIIVVFDTDFSVMLYTFNKWGYKMKIENEILQKVMEWVAVILVAFASFYATLQGTITDVKIMKPKVDQQEINISVMQTDLKYIREGISEIKQVMKK